MCVLAERGRQWLVEVRQRMGEQVDELELSVRALRGDVEDPARDLLAVPVRAGAAEDDADLGHDVSFKQVSLPFGLGPTGGEFLLRDRYTDCGVEGDLESGHHYFEDRHREGERGDSRLRLGGSSSLGSWATRR